ncbi:ArsR/SmtB family transcription factor [Frigidibacter sp. MR17.24]|uniref:ArsR/SmtB family transcription factor n=1 Tax=Frigidibacter sp. MR17.24 TaxID=3127345 RepID=UPI0030129DFB
MTGAAAEDEIPLMAEMFRLLGDPTRLRILIACLDGPIPVGAIAAATGASQTLVSHHLRLLRAARLVRGEKRARHVLYALTDAHVSQMLRDMIDHAREDPRSGWGAARMSQAG